jgi:hypothetical protein
LGEPVSDKFLELRACCTNAKKPFDGLRVNGFYIEIIDFFRSAELVEA